MAEFFANSWDFMLSLGEEHHVDPVLFAILYFGTIPPYMGSMVWSIRNFRKGKGITVPVLSTSFFFILPALYVVIFGRNVTWWVYVVIVCMLVYGSYSAYQKFRAKVQESAPED